MKKMKTKFSVLFAGIFAIALMAFIPKSTYQDPWPVPDTYKNKVNPLKGNAESLVTGKTLYNQHCKSCHGTKGKGDGPKAGSLYYKTEKGRIDMPSYKTKIPAANDMWAVVNYMRTLK